MARPVFWPTQDSYVLSVGGFPNAGIGVRIWTQQTGGSQVTDLVAVAANGTIGSAISGGVLVSDSNGLLPAFAGPDGGPTTLWGDHGLSGERLALTSGPVTGGASVTFGTTSGTAAEGNDSRIVGALAATTAATTYGLRTPDYVAGRAYIVGEQVAYSGTLYRITTAYTSSGGSLDLTKATAISGSGGSSAAAGIAIALGSF